MVSRHSNLNFENIQDLFFFYNSNCQIHIKKTPAGRKMGGRDRALRFIQYLSDLCVPVRSSVSMGSLCLCQLWNNDRVTVGATAPPQASRKALHSWASSCESEH